MTTNKRLKLVPAIARLDNKPRRQTTAQRTRQQRQAQAWRKAALAKQLFGPKEEAAT